MPVPFSPHIPISNVSGPRSLQPPGGTWRAVKVWGAAPRGARPVIIPQAFVGACTMWLLAFPILSEVHSAVSPEP